MQIPPQIVQLLIWRNGKRKRKKRKQLRSHKGHIFIFNTDFSSLFLLLYFFSYFLFESHLHLHGIEAFFDGQGVRERGIAHIFFVETFFALSVTPSIFCSDRPSLLSYVFYILLSSFPMLKQIKSE